MTTTTDQTADTNGRGSYRTVFILIGVVAFAVGVCLTLNLGLNKAAETRTGSMKDSLISHGIAADDAFAEKVSKACALPSDKTNVPTPLSTSIIQDYKGKKSVITLMCDGDSRISEIAAVPAS